MSEKIDRVIKDFNNGFNCSQVIFRNYAEQFGLDISTASKIACPFGGGLGGMGLICGAITGAYMVIGLKHGNSDAADQQTKKKNYELIKNFTKNFESRNGSTICNQLKGDDRSLCVKYLKDAIEILEELV